MVFFVFFEYYDKLFIKWVIVEILICVFLFLVLKFKVMWKLYVNNYFFFIDLMLGWVRINKVRVILMNDKNLVIYF